MNTSVIKLILLFLATTVFAVFANQILWPYLVDMPLFAKYKLDQNLVYLTEKQETTIQENKALKNAVEKVAKTVVSIKSTTAKGAVLEESGLILASDGLIAALSDLMPVGAAAEIRIDGQVVPFQIEKRDKASNLVLVKVEKTNLPTASYYQMENLQLGERIFLIGNLPAKKIVNEGIVRSFTADLIETNIIDNAEAASSPVFDIEGNILGLALVAKDGRVTVLPVTKIKAVSGL